VRSDRRSKEERKGKGKPLLVGILGVLTGGGLRERRGLRPYHLAVLVSRPWRPREHRERSLDGRQKIDGEADWVEGATRVVMGEESAVGRGATRGV
jgi:hypothetical protein